MNYCVLIPTYNNDRTLTRVIEGVLKHTPNIIVINDGATDSTALLLKNYQQLLIEVKATLCKWALKGHVSWVMSML